MEAKVLVYHDVNKESDFPDLSTIDKTEHNTRKEIIV